MKVGLLKDNASVLTLHASWAVAELKTLADADREYGHVAGCVLSRVVASKAGFSPGGGREA